MPNRIRKLFDLSLRVTRSEYTVTCHKRELPSETRIPVASAIDTDGAPISERGPGLVRAHRRTQSGVICLDTIRARRTA